MASTDIVKLEQRVDELIAICDKLKQENTLLRDRQELLVEERAASPPRSRGGPIEA